MSSFDSVRIEVARIDVPRPGRYILRAEFPVDAQHFATNAAIVVSRPIGAAIVGHVLALIALAATLIVALVVSGFAIAGA